MKWQNRALLLSLLFAYLTEMWKQNELNRSIMSWRDFWNDFFVVGTNLEFWLFWSNIWGKCRKSLLWLDYLVKDWYMNDPTPRSHLHLPFFVWDYLSTNARVIQSNDDLKQYALNIANQICIMTLLCLKTFPIFLDFQYPSQW